jgi:uncharacterized protein DUF4926
MENLMKSARKKVIKEHDRVVLKKNLPAEKLRAGDVGTIVHIYSDAHAYEVEFVTLEGRTAAVLTIDATDVRPVNSREITHARQLAGAGR